MIDWYGVFHNALWVLGLAVALASLSYSDWRRRTSEPRISLRAIVGDPGFQMAFSVGMVLFCAGIALGGAVWWQTLGWALLALAFVWLAFSAWRMMRRERAVQADEEEDSDSP